MFLCKYTYKIKSKSIRTFEEQLKMSRQKFFLLRQKQNTHFNGKIPSGILNGFT